MHDVADRKSSMSCKKYRAESIDKSSLLTTVAIAGSCDEMHPRRSVIVCTTCIAGQPELFLQTLGPLRQDTAFGSQASASPRQPLQQEASWGASPLGNHGSIWSSTPCERCRHSPAVHMILSATVAVSLYRLGIAHDHGVYVAWAMDLMMRDAALLLASHAEQKLERTLWKFVPEYLYLAVQQAGYGRP